MYQLQLRTDFIIEAQPCTCNKPLTYVRSESNFYNVDHWLPCLQRKYGVSCILAAGCANKVDPTHFIQLYFIFFTLLQISSVLNLMWSQFLFSCFIWLSYCYKRENSFLPSLHWWIDWGLVISIWFLSLICGFWCICRVVMPSWY